MKNISYIGLLAITGLVLGTGYILNSISMEEESATYKLLEFDSVEIFQSYHDKDYNDFFEEIHYISLDTNPYSPFRSVINVVKVNDTLYITDINSKGVVYKYTNSGEFLDKIGIGSTIQPSGITDFDICRQSGDLLIGDGNERTMHRFSSTGELLSTDTLGFYFGNFRYSKAEGRFIFHTYMPEPGFSDSLNHQIAIVDSSFQILDLLFPKGGYILAQEYNIIKSFRSACPDCDYIYYGDFYKGEIYRVYFDGSTELEYVVIDGIENRDDSLIAINPLSPNYETTMHNKSFYPMTDFGITEDFIILQNYLNQQTTTTVVFSREHLSGTRFVNNIPMNIASSGPFNFHFERPRIVMGDYFVTVKSADRWNNVISHLNDSIDLSMLPSPATSGPVLKMFKYAVDSIVNFNAGSGGQRLVGEPSASASILIEDLTVSPNPTTGVLNITLEGMNLSDLRIDVANQNGVLIATYMGKSSIDLSENNIPAGNYILLFNEKTGGSFQKIGTKVVTYLP
nr:6-bladed beta-propeller [Saprospiraceae bacterium]